MYRSYQSPVGELGLYVEGGAVTSVLFANQERPRVESSLSDEYDEEVLDQLVGELDAYFAGELHEFTVPVHVETTTAFNTSARAALSAVPYAERLTYTELAAQCGRPDAVRAVGTVCSTNPTPIIVPCHRVVPASGAVGQYLGGEQAKRWLLDHEQRHALSAVS